LKTVSDDLFRLIRSLNKSEKGNFKKFASKNEAGSKQNYILLFDAIDSMDTYDESLLREKLKKHTFIKQLPVYKVYLFNLILRSIAPNSAFNDAGSRIRELIENARILSSKALYKEALKLLKKAKETAGKFSNYLLMLEILIAERNIISVMPGRNISEMRREIYKKQSETVKKLEKLFDYSWLSDQMVICVEQKGDFTLAGRAKEMDNIYQEPLIANTHNAEDLNMMFYLLHTKLFYHLGKNELDNVRELLKKEIHLLEENRHFIEDNPKNYSSALINLLLFSQITGRKKDVLESISKLNVLRRKLKNRVPLSIQLQITFHAANTEMLVYRSSGDIRRGRNLVKKMEIEIPKNESEIPPQLKVSLISNIASFLVLDRDYLTALKYNNKLIDTSGLDFKRDVYLFAKLLNLVIHYELKNFDLLEYMVENTYKFFRDKHVMNKAESLLLTHFKRLLKEGISGHKDLFDELYHNIKRLPPDNNSQNLLAMFSFDAWAHAHATGISMQESIKQRLK
jgi:hypothetical protein